MNITHQGTLTGQSSVETPKIVQNLLESTLSKLGKIIDVFTATKKMLFQEKGILTQ